MREIKFRVWDEIHKVMHYGREFAVALDGELRFLEVSPVDYTLRDQVLMQFTGLRDKNGVEIYEGDILEVKQDPPWSHEGRSVVACFYDRWALTDGGNLDECHKWFFDAGMRPLFDWKFHTKVIGNRFEHPELLK